MIHEGGSLIAELYIETCEEQGFESGYLIIDDVKRSRGHGLKASLEVAGFGCRRAVVVGAGGRGTRLQAAIRRLIIVDANAPGRGLRWSRFSLMSATLEKKPVVVLGRTE